MNHLSETALEQYLLGGDDAAIEEHLLACDDCAAHVRAQIELEMQLGEVARAAVFCPGCNRILSGERCDACGATLQAGGYRIERVLVRTTHGRLYAAVDGSGNRVALKELAFVQAPTLESLAAFDRETKFLRALSHPCIPRFHASFIEGTGIHTRMYIAQDLVDGESLLERLQTHWFTDAEIVDIARRVLDILIYLQALSPMVFHRDIKPANLIVRADGSIALVDFGAARDVSETMGNTAVGTFGYMPLEQMAGIYDATTDLFALGASLLHLLTRREPWKLLDGSGVGLNVSLGLRAYLTRLCARKPKDRFSDARAARVALDELNNTPSKPTRRVSRAGVIGVVALLGVGAGAGALVALSEDRPIKASAPEYYTPRPSPPVVVPRPSPPVARPSPPVEPEPPPVEEPARPTYLDVEEFLGLGIVGASDRVRCSIRDRLPSGAWPRRCILKERLLPREVEQRLASLPAHDREQLRPQLDYAFDQVAKYPDSGIAIGKISMPPAKPGEQPARPPLYYAAAVGGRLEIAQHGLRRRAFIAVPVKGAVKWMPDVVLEEVEADGATVFGNATMATTIQASLVHGSVSAAGLVESVWWTPSMSARVTGAYEFPKFTPGKYRFTVTSAVASQDFEITLRPGERYDLGAALTPTASLAPGKLHISSRPRATLAIDGVETGLSTPTVLELAAGKHKIQFAYGTTRSSFSVLVQPNKTIMFHKDLE